jgi:hypothetical protein
MSEPATTTELAFDARRWIDTREYRARHDPQPPRRQPGAGGFSRRAETPRAPVTGFATGQPI